MSGGKAILSKERKFNVSYRLSVYFDIPFQQVETDKTKRIRFPRGIAAASDAPVTRFMTDEQHPFEITANDRTGRSVTSLAETALAVLASKSASGRPPMSEDLLADLTDAARARNGTAVDAAVEHLFRVGIPAEEIMDFYIPEAARRLGEDWCSDAMGFAEVTIGSAHLQRALRGLMARAGDPGLARRAQNSVLVVVMENHYHTLGAMVVAHQLRRLGASVRLLLGEADRRVLQTVASGHFDAIFLSIAMVERLSALRDLVEKIRQTLPAPVPIVVGGAVGNLGTDVGEVTGADYTATNANEALRLCGLTVTAPGVGHPHGTSG